MTELPTTLIEFLWILATQGLLLGALSAAALELIFRWWETSRPPVERHLKTFVAVLTPPLVAGLAYSALVALGQAPWSVPDLAQAVYVGFKAAIGAQLVYNLVKRIPAEPVPPQP